MVDATDGASASPPAALAAAAMAASSSSSGKCSHVSGCLAARGARVQRRYETPKHAPGVSVAQEAVRRAAHTPISCTNSMSGDEMPSWSRLAVSPTLSAYGASSPAESCAAPLDAAGTAADAEAAATATAVAAAVEPRRSLSGGSWPPNTAPRRCHQPLMSLTRAVCAVGGVRFSRKCAREFEREALPELELSNDCTMAVCGARGSGGGGVGAEYAGEHAVAGCAQRDDRGRRRRMVESGECRGRVRRRGCARAAASERHYAAEHTGARRTRVSGDAFGGASPACGAWLRLLFGFLALRGSCAAVARR